MFCSHCGAEVSDGAAFCPVCGQQLSHSAQPVAQPAAQPAAAPAPAPVPVRKRRGVLPFALAGAGIVVVAIAGVLVWMLFFAPWKIDDKNFPDAAVRATVSKRLDSDLDGEFSRDEGRALKDLSVDGALSVDGLGKFFPELQKLTLTGDKLATISTGDLAKLSSLDVRGTPIASLDLSKNTELVRLDAQGTRLASLDVSKNAKLAALNVDGSVKVAGLEQAGLREVSLASRVISYDGFGGSPEDPQYTHEAEYNSDGTIASITETYDTGKSVGLEHYQERRTFSYRDGALVSGTHLFYDGSTADISYTVDGSGRVQRAEGALDTGGSYTDEYEYDASGRLTKSTEYTGYGSTLIAAYAYDDRGNCTKVEYQHQTKDNEVYPGISYVYTYDDKGRCITQALSVAPDHQRHFEYDDKGRIVKVSDDELPADAVEGSSIGDGSTFYFGADLHETTLAYDDAGKLNGLTMKLRFSQWNSTSEENWQVATDEQGRVISATSQLGSGEGDYLEYHADQGYRVEYRARAFVRKGAREPVGAFTVMPSYQTVGTQAPAVGMSFYEALPGVVSPEPFTYGWKPAHD